MKTFVIIAAALLYFGLSLAYWMPHVEALFR